MLIERALDFFGINAVFTRHPPLPLAGLPPDVLVSPCQGLLDKLAPIDGEGRFEEKPVLGRPRRLALSDLRLPAEFRDLFLHGLYLKIYLAPWDRHGVVCPHAARVLRQDRVQGSALPLVFMPSADLENRKHGLLMQTSRGDYYYLMMIGSFMVNSLAVLARTGQNLATGQRLGEFRLGSSVVLLFPPRSVEPLVAEGAKLGLGRPLLRWRCEP
ncbi:phosphatidylserine decarboxylase [bacterium]|nr:phosphatidylserine decarboxylase [bacterium]